jgi:hypothetical protein
MRTSYLICYDICADKRLRKVFQTMRGYGDHLQYSVFECQLTATDLARCREELAALPSAAVREAGAGVGFDGAVSSADCGFGGADGGEHGDGDGAGLCESGRGRSADRGGRKAFFRTYEMRMDTLVTTPLFEYRVSYRRMLEIQARLLARVLEGEIAEYPVFTTR